MKHKYKLAAALVAVIFIAYLPASANASNLTQSTYSFGDSNPWVEFDNLPKGIQKKLLDSFSKEGVPDVFLEINPDGSAVADTLQSQNGTLYTVSSGEYLIDVASNAFEFLSCVAELNLIMCNSVKDDADKASSSAVAKFPDSLWNGKGDAYRHCYWSGLMTHHIGSGNALWVANNHEYWNPNDLAELEMDTFNNKQGRLAGLHTARDVDVLNTCYSWAKNGTLFTLY